MTLMATDGGCDPQGEITFTERDIVDVLRARYEIHESDPARRDLVLSIGFALADKLTERHGKTAVERKAFLSRLFQGG